MKWQGFFDRKNFRPKIKEVPKKELGIVVVIPCYNEPNLYDSLKSLANCERPPCQVEVIVVVNHPEGSSNEIINQSQKALSIVDDTNKELGHKNLRFLSIPAFNLPIKHAGVGYARQIGMDEAAFRFLSVSNYNGIIACFDADTECMPNYLVELYRLWQKYPKTHACSIWFEHPIDGGEFSDEIYEAIVEYELHLRYYNLASRYIGFPFAYHTVGSAMACSAEAYVKFGGMNRRQAGEDFYFLQKIIPHGQFRELNSTCIYPSPRISNRVPFGTGKVIAERITKKDAIFTYNLESFLDLKPFLVEIEKLFDASDEQTAQFINRQKLLVKDFFTLHNATVSIRNIRKNTSNAKSFKKRFFVWFDGFLLLKFLNFASENFYEKKPVVEETIRLLSLMEPNTNITSNPKALLALLRDLNRKEYVVKL